MNQPAVLHQEEIQSANRRLSETLIANSLLASLLAIVTGAAIAMIYALTQFGLVEGDSSPLLLGVAAATLLIAAGFSVGLSRARQGRGLDGQLAVILSTVAFALVVAALWRGIAPVLIAIVWSQTILALAIGVPRRTVITAMIISTIGTALVLALEYSLPYPRLLTDTLATNVSIGFLISLAALLFVTLLVANSFRFRRLQNQLILTSLAAVAAPLVAMSIIFAVNGYNSTRDQIANSLQAITSLKEKQADQLIVAFQEDVLRIERDVELSQSLQYLLKPAGQEPAQTSRFRTIALSHLHEIQASEETYKEIWVLDAAGNVVLSTTPEDEGGSYGNEIFFQNGRNGFAAFIPGTAPFNRGEIVITEPILELHTNNFLGLLVLRSDIGLLKNITDTTEGLPSVRTYVLSQDMSPITNDQIAVSEAEKQAVRDAMMSGDQTAAGIYANYSSYTGSPVLGYFKWYKPLEVLFAAEVPQTVIYQNIRSAVIASTLTGIFGIAITLIAVMIAARSISDPIQRLEQSAQSLASGNLNIRADLVRRDELGTLTGSFNAMADNLQEVIGTLEERVAARTRELEGQSLRLRTAAEIARDAASARNLDDLLNRAARLIRDRFELYHTGIFLMDKNNEYAVLRASPTEAGRQMLANNHRLKVGETGIVGYVASSGQPRIALDTGQDAAFFDNPYLPKTRSEMALPLVADNVVIGVLDVQSDQPQAFSQEDIDIMQVMADQLATAIEKTRLLSELESHLQELERANLQYTREGWKDVGGKKGMTGYVYDQTRLGTSTEVPPLARAALETGATTYSNHLEQTVDNPRIAAIPVKLRGQTIGAVNVRFKGETIPDETVRLIEAIADRLAVAVENARLVQDSQRRASLEYTISQMSNKIGSATEVDAVLKATAQELGKLLPDTEVAVHLLTSQEPEGGRE